MCIDELIDINLALAFEHLDNVPSEGIIQDSGDTKRILQLIEELNHG